ncbi:hypothetical protein J5N97_028108 [Dioscorea zingiberensis]|uniref:Uncharacterized protein n=1 Tax=Dioscorea zingiberensis TaxID=325984 RepID=A0A9D5H4L7_9LILI|nr:hypothetical protein J5N97_028108 [Dioscorea zingiberensis]
MERSSNHQQVAILVSPGIGHLIPAVEFAKKLTIHHNLHVTLITQSTSSSLSMPEQSILDSFPEELNLLCLPAPSQLKNLPEGTRAISVIFLTIAYNLPLLRTILKSLVYRNSRLALVVDLLGVEALDMATELGISSYLFYTSNCMSLSLSLHIPKLDAEFSGQYRDLQKPLELPGCLPLSGKDFPDPLPLRGSEGYAKFISYAKCYTKVKGILVNSFEELEPGVVKALKENLGVPRVYPVGPVIQSGLAKAENDYECLKWLDEQPQGSVLYVSFGSGGTLTGAQMEELAWGLEMSGQRFLWVAKSPHEHEPSSALATAQSLKNNPAEFLPIEFVEKTKGFGMVVSSWVPQMEKLNSVLLVEGVKIALGLVKDDDGLVRREEISRVIKCLMEGVEGKKIREKMREVNEAAARAVGKAGSSSRYFMELVSEWKS